VSQYRVGHTHSHRWNAAERARAEKGIPFSKYEIKDPSEIFRSQSRLESLKKQGLLDKGSSIVQEKGKVYKTTAVPFADAGHPFPHNAHHIIPMGRFQDSIDTNANAAAPNAGRMYNFIVGGLITEPYNINGQPNMIILPTQRSPAKTLGLPLHLARKKRDHPAYSTMVENQFKGVFKRSYSKLAQEVSNAAHGKVLTKNPKMKPTLDKISNAMYKALVALSTVLRGKAKTLDALSGALKDEFKKAIASA